MPIVSDRASSVTTFSDWSIGPRMAKVGISDIGMAVAAITVARQSRRKIHTTMTASTAPRISASSEAR